MKPSSWIIFIASIIIVCAILIPLSFWFDEWKDRFFYLDDWRMWAALFIGFMIIRSIYAWALKTELRVLK